MASVVPLWRREPYRVFFPLGLLLAWAGVLHWLLHAIGVLPDYRPVFHAITQIQGFMLAFALGFLFTAIPRRTGTAPPAAWQMAVGVIAPIGTALAAWYERFDVSQVCWFVIVAVLVHFAVTRFRSSQASRRPPVSFVWIPLSFLMGLVGSALIGAYGVLGDEYYQLHELGRLLLLQGLFVGLVIGVGGMLLPLVTRKEGSTDSSDTAEHRIARLGHLLGALLLAVSFVIESRYSLQGGLALRAALVLVLLLVTGRIWRPPTVPGWQRLFVWVAAWMLPLGYALAAAFPYQKKAGLHVVFIGGFALMAFAVGLHVTLSHSGRRGDEQRVKSWFLPVLPFGIAMLVAAGLRALVDFDPDRFFVWIGCSAGAFLVATAIWAAIVLPRAWGRRASE